MPEFASPAFWVALLQIISADILLSGDNAVVIALATRSLPPRQQRKAILLGTVAAVSMRVTLTMVAAALLRLPVLKLIGALLLLWIAVQLLLPEEENFRAASLGGGLGIAIRTILIADLVMSTDNIIAIAAVAKGNFLLLLTGLAVSIPLVIFTSTFLLKIMERYPLIITLGAALLGYVAGEMAVSDPFAAAWVDTHAAWLHRVAPAAGALAVVVLGKILAGRAQADGRLPESETAIAATITKEPAMHAILLPVDGSQSSLRAIDQLIAMRDWYCARLDIHLLNVQHVLHQDVSQFVAAAEAQGYLHDEGGKALAEACARLDRVGLPYRHHVVAADDVAEAIARYAGEHGIDQILMCTHGHSALTDALMGSVTKGVLQRSKVPLTLVR